MDRSYNLSLSCRVMRPPRKDNQTDAILNTTIQILAAQLHHIPKTHHTKIIAHPHKMSEGRLILASCRRKRTHTHPRTPTHDKPAQKRGKSHRHKEEGVRKAGS
jgi:hypothetical protein